MSDDLKDMLYRAKNMTLPMGALWNLCTKAAARIAALEDQLTSVLQREGATQARHDARAEALEAEVAAAKAGRVTVKPLIKPLADFGVRELARAAGISPTTAGRVHRGETDLDGATMRAVMSVTGQCLCCGNSLMPPEPAPASKDAVAEAARVLADFLEEVDQGDPRLDQALMIANEFDDANSLERFVSALRALSEGGE